MYCGGFGDDGVNDDDAGFDIGGGERRVDEEGGFFDVVVVIFGGLGKGVNVMMSVALVYIL